MNSVPKLQIRYSDLLTSLLHNCIKVLHSLANSTPDSSAMGVNAVGSDSENNNFSYSKNGVSNKNYVH